MKGSWETSTLAKCLVNEHLEVQGPVGTHQILVVPTIAAEIPCHQSATTTQLHVVLSVPTGPSIAFINQSPRVNLFRVRAWQSREFETGSRETYGCVRDCCISAHQNWTNRGTMMISWLATLFAQVHETPSRFKKRSTRCNPVLQKFSGPWPQSWPQIPHPRKMPW